MKIIVESCRIPLLEWPLAYRLGVVDDKQQLINGSNVTSLLAKARTIRREKGDLQCKNEDNKSIQIQSRHGCAGIFCHSYTDLQHITCPYYLRPSRHQWQYGLTRYENTHARTHARTHAHTHTHTQHEEKMALF